jgi:hypothetical protein
MTDKVLELLDCRHSVYVMPLRGVRDKMEWKGYRDLNRRQKNRNTVAAYPRLLSGVECLDPNGVFEWLCESSDSGGSMLQRGTDDGVGECGGLES